MGNENKSVTGKGNLKIIIIGGIAAGTSAAAKARRKSENAEIVIYEKYKYVSLGTCGLPYYVSGRINDIENLIINTTSMFQRRFNIRVNVLHEVLAINPESKTIRIKDLKTGREFSDSYDRLIIATGSSRIVINPELNNASNSFELGTIDDAIRLKEYMKHLSNSSKALPQKPAGTQEKTSGPAAVIAGGGYIGLELVEAFLTFGFKVTVI